MFSAETLTYIKLPLKLGFKVIFVVLGYNSASWLSVFLVLGIHLSFLGLITSAPTRLVQTEMTNIHEFGTSEETVHPQINRRLIWPRIKAASWVLFLGATNALVCYLIGFLFAA